MFTCVGCQVTLCETASVLILLKERNRACKNCTFVVYIPPFFKALAEKKLPVVADVVKDFINVLSYLNDCYKTDAEFRVGRSSTEYVRDVIWTSS